MGVPPIKTKSAARRILKANTWCPRRQALLLLGSAVAGEFIDRVVGRDPVKLAAEFMSVLPPTTDIAVRTRDGRCVPTTVVALGYKAVLNFIWKPFQPKGSR